MAGTIAPFPKHQFFTNAGAPAAGYYLHSFLAGTSTQTPTYTDQALGSSNTNPIVLDASGRATIFLDPAISYKFQLALSTDTTPPASPIWSVDSVSAVPPASTSADVDVSVTGGETITTGQLCYVSDGSGGATAGRAYKADADQTYSSTAARVLGLATADISTGSSGTIRTEGRVTGLSGLVAGTVYYVSATAGGLTSSAPTNARAVGIADSTTSIIISPWAGTVDAAASTSGLVNATTQTFTGAKTLTIAADSSANGAITYKPGTSSAADATHSGLFHGSVDTTQRANSGTGETTLSSFSLPANALSANTKGIRISAWGTFAATANTKTLKAKFGATSITLFANTFNGGTWKLDVIVWRTGAATQKMIAFAPVLSGGTTFNHFGTASPSETLSGAVTILTTGQDNTASSGILQEAFFVEAIG